MEIILLIIIVLILLFGRNFVIDLLGGLTAWTILISVAVIGIIIILFLLLVGFVYMDVTIYFLSIVGFFYSFAKGLKMMNSVDEHYSLKENNFLSKVFDNKLFQLIILVSFIFLMIFLWKFIADGLVYLLPDTLKNN